MTLECKYKSGQKVINQLVEEFLAQYSESPEMRVKALLQKTKYYQSMGNMCISKGIIDDLVRQLDSGELDISLYLRAKVRFWDVRNQKRGLDFPLC